MYICQHFRRRGGYFGFRHLGDFNPARIVERPALGNGKLNFFEIFTAVEGVLTDFGHACGYEYFLQPDQAAERFAYNRCHGLAPISFWNYNFGYAVFYTEHGVGISVRQQPENKPFRRGCVQPAIYADVVGEIMPVRGHNLGFEHFFADRALGMLCPVAFAILFNVGNPPARNVTRGGNYFAFYADFTKSALSEL